MDYFKTDYVGQVTAVVFSDVFLLYGIGPFLCISNIKTGKLILKSCVFENGCIHGIKLISQKKEQILELCLWGETSVRVVRVAVDAGVIETSFFKICKDWILDCIPLIENDNICVTVGMSHCQIETWNIITKEIISSYKIEEEEGIIYSLSFKEDGVDRKLYVAIGNLFNEVHVYSLPDCKLISKLIGHKGVVFKINWSNSLQDICTASDDRSIRLWCNVLDSKEEESSIERSSTLILYGHLCRVWDCLILNNNKYIISSGEDTQCRIWDVSSGNCVAVLTGHQGKHIRAIAVNKEQTVLATGGGDSQIRLWDIEEVVGSKGNEYRLVLPSNKKKETIRIVSIVDKNTLVTVTDIYFYMFDIDTSQVIYSKSLNRRYQTMLCISKEHIVLGDVDGWISLLDTKKDDIIEVKAHSKTVVALFSHNININTLSFFSSGYDGLLICISLNKQKNGLEVKNKYLIALEQENSKKRPSIIYSIDFMLGRNLLIAGDSNGRIHLFNMLSEEDFSIECNLPLASSSNVHNSERVGGILIQEENVYSVGRDGNLCYSKITRQENNIKIEFVSSCSPNNKFEMIETLILTKEKQLYAVGFFGTNFIVENITHNYKVAHVNCGGYKRSHNLLFVNYDDWIFAYVKDNQIFVNYSQKQSDLFLTRTLEHSQSHGFHINTITLLYSDEHSTKFITGSEDTTMRIFEYDNRMLGKLQSLVTLQGHSGGIKSLYSIKSPFTNDHYIFSGSAFSELKIWRLCCSPESLNFKASGQYVGGSGFFKCVTNISKAKADMHIRITALCVIPTRFENIHSIVCIQSDAKIKIYIWHELTQQYSIIASHNMQSALLCIQHVYISKDRGGILFIGANNGKIYVCDISSILEQASSVVSQKLSLRILSEVNAHQCGVNNVIVESLCNSSISDQMSNRNLLVSASDDQSIYVCHFALLESENGISFINRASLSRLACNTGITGLQYCGGLIFTCGSDQRLNIWEALLDEEKLEVNYKGGVFTEVPDVSSLLVVPQQDNELLCFITGYLAMQTIKLTKC